MIVVAKTLSISLVVGTLLALSLLVSSPQRADAQAATEVFIPIGQSPGVSTTGLSVLGTISLFHPDTLSLCVQTRASVVCATIAREMPVYLDRTHLQQTNTVGRLRDLRVGQTIELYPRHWIKIRVEP